MKDQIDGKINSTVAYASIADFCDVFLSNVNRLYLLAYLLTGHHDMAERCFVAGLDDCIYGSSAFKAWVKSWARRAIIKSAILMISPEPEIDSELLDKNHLPVVSRREGAADLLHNVIQLERFERCVFVMSVLERFSDHECSLLLSSTRGEVARGRRSAIEHLASVRVPDCSISLREA